MKKTVKLLIRFSTKKQLHRINFAFSTFIRHTISGLTNIQLHILQKKILGFESIIRVYVSVIKMRQSRKQIMVSLFLPKKRALG